jgi:streptolysin S family bacteriocin protoxin
MKRAIVFAPVFISLLLMLSFSDVFSGGGGGGGALRLVTYSEFLAAWNAGRIQPVTEWNNGFESHYPGMSSYLRTPNLAVKEEIPQCPGEPGVGMAWGTSADNGKNIIGAWQYEYGADPNLTGFCAHVCVFPPCRINSISFGMKDINGNVKSWDWTVGAGGVLPCSTQVCFSINLGGGAGQANATSFYEDPGFDITNVIYLMFDENGTWVDSVEADPFGFNEHVWNYWKNIFVEQGTPVGQTTWGEIKSLFLKGE